MTAPRTDPLLRPGAMVGEYEIAHLLGEGGMGVVYAAIHPEIGKRVAIKVLAPHAAEHPDLIRRFKEEARAVNRIRHPNIIDIFAFNQLSDGRHYFVMEYLDGESLTARLERGSMQLSEIRRLLAQICSALQAAHDAGIIHRDLKPDNVWVATQHLSQPQIKLLDFGIAKLADAANIKATQTGAPIGTPHYMAPEQAMGRPVDHRADIYALGVVLYQIFAGALPFDGATVHEIVFKHVTEAPRPPSTLRPVVPPGMEGIIIDCLQKDPAHRPPSMRELGARIESAFAAHSGADPEAGAVILPLSRASTTLRAPTPGRTELLPEPNRAPALSAAAARLTDDGWARPARRRWVWPLAGIGVAAVVVVGVNAGLLKRWFPNPPDPAASGNRAEPARPSSPPRAAVDPPLEPVVAPSGRTDSPLPAPAPAQPEPHRVVVPSPPPPRHEQKRRPGRKAADAIGHAAKTSNTEHDWTARPATPPADKPNCNPNFYLDAQGDKHFKPECF